MNIGEVIYYNWAFDGGSIIRYTNKGYELFEVPMFGGEEHFINTFTSLAKVKEAADKLT